MEPDQDAQAAGGEHDKAGTAAEWQAEAEKWKQQAREHEAEAKRNAGAAQAFEQAQARIEGTEADTAKQVAETVAEAEARIAETRAEGERTAAEWQAEAEKWKGLAAKHEDRSKANALAAAQLEQLEAGKVDANAEIDAAKAEIEAKATDAELVALRHKVAAEYRLPAELQQFLTGNSEREIQDHADRLLATIERHPKPEPEPEPTGEPDPAKVAELAEVQARAAAAEAKALRFEVANTKGLPAELVEFLTADNREALEAQADALLTHVGSQGEQSSRAKMPARNLRPGSMPDDGPYEREPDPDAIAEKIIRNRRGY